MRVKRTAVVQVKSGWMTCSALAVNCRWKTASATAWEFTTAVIMKTYPFSVATVSYVNRRVQITTECHTSTFNWFVHIYAKYWSTFDSLLQFYWHIKQFVSLIYHHKCSARLSGLMIAKI